MEPRPYDPKCKRFADQIEEYVELAELEETTPDEYVRTEEGTYNPKNGHFLCTTCYVAAGMPSGPRGWVCP